MASDNSVSFDMEFTNYYRELDLNRTQSTSELRTEIMALLKDYNSMLSSTEQDKNPELYEDLEEKMDYCRKAFVIFHDDASRQEYDKALDEHAESENAYGKYEEIYDEASKYFDDERYEITIELCKKLIQLNPNSPKAYTLLCNAHYQLGYYNEAVEIINEACAAFNTNIFLRWFQIRLYVMLDKYQRAQQLLNSALEEFPMVSDFHALQAYMYFKVGNNTLARKKIEEYLASNPTDVQYRDQVCKDLLKLAYLCYYYFPNEDERILLDKNTYDKCKEYIVLANQISNLADAREELEYITYLGKKSFSFDLGALKGGIVLVVIGCFLLYVVYYAATASSSPDLNIGFIICAIVALLPLVSGVKRLSKLRKPNWEIIRDSARGYSDYDRSLWGSIV